MFASSAFRATIGLLGIIARMFTGGRQSRRRTAASRSFNLRQASQPGADIEGKAAVAKTAAISCIHLPFNAASPDRAVVDTFQKAVSAPPTLRQL